MVRYLRPAALTAASLVLLLATDGTAAQSVRLSYEETASRTAAGAPKAHAAPAPTPSPAPATALPDPGAAKLVALPRTVFTGSGFDACSAPPLDAMRAWRGASPYGAVGIYTSGRQRACAQTRLTVDWVRQVRALGWRMIPTHVGRQAPCAAIPSKPQRIDPARAVQQGREEAAEAVSGARGVGIGKGSPIYLDMEAYAPGDAACAKAVVDFTRGWTQALHSAGYRSGFYSSLDSGMTDLVAAARAGAGPLPDAVWYARWDGRSSTDGGGVLGADQWTGHQRVHQLSGNVTETYGGVELVIDRDQLDGPVAR